MLGLHLSYMVEIFFSFFREKSSYITSACASRSSGMSASLYLFYNNYYTFSVEQ